MGERAPAAHAARRVGLLLLLLVCVACGGGGSARITTETLPDGVVGAAYGTTLKATGDGELFWGFVSGRLPPGLALSQGGRLEGMPAAEGDFAFTVRVTSAEGEGDEADLSLHVEGGEGSIRLTTRTLPEGQVGEPYSERLEAEGGVAPYRFGIAAGALPPGLSLSLGGLLDGTPTDGVDTTLTIRIFDEAGGAGAGQVTLRILGSNEAPHFDTDLLDEGTVGEPYGFTLEASGGLAPLTFSSTGRDLPEGLALEPDGTLSGTPAEGGLFSLTFQVTDASDRSVARDFYLPIDPADLVLTTAALPTGRTGQEYVAQLEAEGGVAPYRFDVVRGSLPEGLALDPGGALSGTPTTGEGSTVGFRVRDAEGRTAERDLAVLVEAYVEVHPAIELPGTCEVQGTESFSAELPFAVAGMVSEVDVGVGITYSDISYLTVALESPTGKRVVLFAGDYMGNGEQDLDAFYDEEDVPVGSLAQLVGEPTQGTWRLTVSITTSAWGDCTEVGSIDRFALAIATNTSPDNYLRISGWDSNNLIEVPWVRITGGGLPQHSIDFEVHEWSTGDNGIPEGTYGDDVDLGGAALDWSTDVDAEVGGIDAEGLFTAGETTGAGTITAVDGDTTYDFEILVVPPDWVP